MAPAPPAVFSPAAPSAGPYGTAITILGANFGDAGSVQVATGSGPVLLPSTTFQADAGELWQPDRITFRYPFPAEGNITVKNGAGAADAGTFTPSWIPGTPVSQDQDDYTPFPSTQRIGPGTVAGTIRYPDPPFVYGGWGVLIHDGVSPQLFHLNAPVGYSAVLSISLVADAGPQPEGIALVSTAVPDGGATVGTVMRLGWAAGLPDLQPTGFTARTALGAGYDPTGFFAWAGATDGGLVRLRPAAPSWVVDKTLAPPTGFGTGGHTAQIFFLNSTLVAQWTVGRNSGFPLFQYFEHPVFAFANAAQTGWLTTESSAGELEGQLDGVNVATTADGKLAIVYSGGFYSTLLLRVLNPALPEVRKAGGGFIRAPTLGTGGSGFVLAPTATDYAGAACDDTGLRVLRPVPAPESGGAVGSGSGEVAVWPCPKISWQAIVDVDGGVMPLVQFDGRLYLVKKR